MSKKQISKKIKKIERFFLTAYLGIKRFPFDRRFTGQWSTSSANHKNAPIIHALSENQREESWKNKRFIQKTEKLVEQRRNSFFRFEKLCQKIGIKINVIHSILTKFFLIIMFRMCITEVNFISSPQNT